MRLARAIYEKDYKLLINCEVTKVHPELLEVITKYPKIELEELKNISEKNYNFFKNVYSRVKNEAISEWGGALDQDIRQVERSKKVKCELCSTNIINVCTIHNKINGKKLNIGTECNNRFKFYNDKDVEKFLKKQMEIRKINKINNTFPDLIKKMSNWRSIISESEIYIMDKVSREYLEVGEKIRDIYNEYTLKNISRKREDDIIQEIKSLLDSSIPLKKNIKKYLDNNKNNLLCPTKKMVESLRFSNSKEQGIKWLEENEKIQLRTLYRFREINFANRVAKIFNDELKKNGARILETNKISNENLGYNIVFDINKDCKFYYRYDYICELFGASVTGEKENMEVFNKESFIKKGLLIDKYSIEYGLTLVEYELSDKNVEMVEIYHSFGDVLWRVNMDDKSEYFYKTSIEKIKDVLKNVLLSLKSYSKKELFEIIKLYSEKLKNKDVKELIRKRSNS